MSNNGFSGLPERPRLGVNNPGNVPGFSRPNPNNVSGNPQPLPQQQIPAIGFQRPPQQQPFQNPGIPQQVPNQGWSSQPQNQPLPNQFNSVPQQPQQLRPNIYQQEQKPAKSKKTATVLAVVFGLLFAVTLVGGFSVVGLNQAEVIEKQREVENLEQQNKDLEQQNSEMKTNLDNKETFGQLSLSYVEKLQSFNGLPVKDRLGKNVARYNNLVQEAYQYREDPYMMEVVIGDAQSELDSLEELRVKYENERNTNATGSAYESGTDSISGGITTVVWYTNGEDKCGESEGSDAAACVWSNSPDLVYVNTDQFNRLGNEAGTRFRDYYYNGVVWHEFAHVMQFYNSETTAGYLGYFDNDREKMADCYADAFYSRDFSSYAYNLGCNNDQIAKVQEWAGAVKFTPSGFVQQ